MGQGLTQRKTGPGDIYVHVETMLCLSPLDFDTAGNAHVLHEDIISLNLRLEGALQSQAHSSIGSLALIGNIADYFKILWWKISGRRWHDSFVTLARLVDVEMERYPGLQLRVDQFGEKWYWKDLAQELGLAPRTRRLVGGPASHDNPVPTN